MAEMAMMHRAVEESAFQAVTSETLSGGNKGLFTIRGEKYRVVRFDEHDIFQQAVHCGSKRVLRLRGIACDAVVIPRLQPLARMAAALMIPAVHFKVW